MNEKIIVYLKKFLDFILSREVGLELIKVILPALIGFFTFKIYQRYKNKKRLHSALY